MREVVWLVAKKAALTVVTSAYKWVARKDSCWVAIQVVMKVQWMVCFVAARWVVKKAVY